MSDMKNDFLLKLILVCTSMAIMIDMAIYPAVETVYGVFADYPIGLVNTVITGTSAMVIVGSVLCGVLAQFVGKKNILAVSYLVFCITTVACAFVNDIYVLLTFRLIAGFTVGLIAISGEALIAELFVEEEKRSRMMGFYTGTMSIFGMIISPIAGMMAVSNWHHLFYVYLIAVPILVGILIVVPKTKPEGKIVKAKGALKENTPWGRILALMVAAFIFNACFAVLFTMNSVFLAEEGLGNASTSGVISAMSSIGSLIACFTFGWIYMRTKRKTPILFAILMAVGFIVYALFESLPILYVAMVVMGAMYGLSFSYFLMYASMITPPSKTSLAMGLVNAAVSLAMFVGPYVAPVYEMITGGATYKSILPYVALTFGVYAVISIVLVTVFKKKYWSESGEITPEP